MSRWSVLLGATVAIGIASLSTSGCKNGGGADNLGIFVPPISQAVISSVVPNSGSTLGSNTITIIGSNFAAGATATVGNTTLINISVPNTSTLIGTIPAGNYPPGSVDVSVVTSTQTAVLRGGYTFANMTFTSITPNNGPITGNVGVVIRGTNFRNIPLNGVTVQAVGNSAIFGTLQNVIVDPTFTQISAIVPSGLPLGPYNLIINSTSFGVLNAGAVYTVGTGQSTTMLITDIRSQPGNVSPAHGPLAGGTTVTLTADLTAPSPAGFVGNINVTLTFPNGAVLSGTNIVVAANFGSLTFVTPAGPAGFFGGPVNVRVDSSTQGFAVAANGFNYDPASTVPMINSVTPALGPQGGGTLVTIQGVNFKSGTRSNVRRVLVGGNPMLGVAVQSTTQLQCTTPPGVIGQQPVIIESTTGQLSNSVIFTYQQAIVLTRLNPNNGPLAGGNAITVIGQNFTTATIQNNSITIGGNPLASINVVNSTTVTGIVPKGGVDGPTDVVVASNGGLPGMTLRQGYTYGPSFDPPGSFVPGTGFVYNANSLGAPQGAVKAVAVGPILGAGTLDAVTVNGPDNSITVVSNVAQLGSSASSIIRIPNASAALGGASPFNNPIDVALADMNGDGLLDVVVLNNAAGGPGVQQIVVLLNNGVGTFTPQAAVACAPTLPATLAATSIDVGDVNSDGRVDVAVLGGSATPGVQNGVAIFLGNGAGGLAANGFNAIGATELGAIKLKIIGGTFGGNPFLATTPIDMNSDGIPDIVTLCKNTATVSVMKGNGNGTFTLLTTTNVGAANPVSFAVGDVDESGTLDIVTANQGNGTNGSITVLLGNGAGALAVFATYTVPGVPSANFQSVVIGDVNFDCRPDVVVANFNGANVSLFIGNGDGSFSTPVQYVAESPANAGTANIVAIAAINNSGGIFAAEGLPAIVCVDAQQPGGQPSQVSVLPRHILDAFLGAFVSTPLFQSSSQGVQPQAVAFGDLNGDGRLDMVLVNRTSNNVQVYIGDGFGNFQQPFAPVPLNPGAQPEGVIIARVDNTSGAPSVLVACNGLNAVALLRNFGGGSLGNPVYIPVDGTGPHAILVADMNADGKADLVTVNQASNNVTILLGDGTGNFTRAVHSPYPTGNGPLGIAIGDVDGNGKLDIVTANFASDDVTVMLNVATTPTDVFMNNSNYALNGPIPTNPNISSGGGPKFVTRGTVEPRSVAIADLNEDGAPDIITADGFTGSLTVLHGKLKGRVTLSAAALAVAVGDNLLGPAIGIQTGNTTTPPGAGGPDYPGQRSYTCKVTNVVSPTVFDVTDLVGGGEHLGGDVNATGVPASPLVPKAFYVSDPIEVQTAATRVNRGTVGGLVSLTNVRPTGTFFLPSNYFSDGTTTNVGNPSVIIPTAVNPSVVRAFDMNDDGHQDIVVGDEGGMQIQSLISQAEANFLVFGSGGLIQTAHNTPTFEIFQLTGTSKVGGPNYTVCPAGEFSIVAADTLIYGLQPFPAVPHSGYPIRLITTPPISGGTQAKFIQSIAGRVLGLDIGHVTLDCPPSVAVVSDDNQVRVFKTR